MKLRGRGVRENFYCMKCFTDIILIFSFSPDTPVTPSFCSLSEAQRHLPNGQDSCELCPVGESLHQVRDASRVFCWLMPLVACSIWYLTPHVVSLRARPSWVLSCIADRFLPQRAIRFASPSPLIVPACRRRGFPPTPPPGWSSRQWSGRLHFFESLLWFVLALLFAQTCIAFEGCQVFVAQEVTQGFELASRLQIPYGKRVAQRGGTHRV